MPDVRPLVEKDPDHVRGSGPFGAKCATQRSITESKMESPRCERRMILDSLLGTDTRHCWVDFGGLSDRHQQQCRVNFKSSVAARCVRLATQPPELA
jgi:hypothetical protein